MNDSLKLYSCFQGRAEEHSSILQGLQLLTEFHKEIIEAQNEKLSKLQEMVRKLLKKKKKSQLFFKFSSINFVVLHPSSRVKLWHSRIKMPTHCCGLIIYISTP